MMMRCFTALMLTSLLMILACDTFVPAPDQSSPVELFDALWSDVDEFYALFEVRGVDWDAAYSTYRPRVHEDLDDAELLEVMCELIGELDDAHMWIAAEGLSYCNSNPNDSIRFFDDGEPGQFEQDYRDNSFIIRENYGGPGAWESWTMFELDPEVIGGHTVLYLNLDSFDHESTRVRWGEVWNCLEAPPQVDGLIIDLRRNPGGYREQSLRMASCLAATARTCAHVQSRNGPDHDDLSPPRAYGVDPTGQGWGEVPVVILTHTYTVSAAEWFLLAMRDRSRTTVVGLTSRGSLSSRSERVLPNGWMYTNCGELVFDADGVCWEGRGVPPDTTVCTTIEALERAHDLALDAALEILSNDL